MPKVERSQDMGMFQGCDGLSLFEKILNKRSFYLLLEHFSSNLRFQVNMLTQIDLSKTTLAQELDQSIVPKLLSDVFCHIVLPLLV